MASKLSVSAQNLNLPASDLTGKIQIIILSIQPPLMLAATIE